MSVFELNVRGYSDWTNAFTLDEWKWFGYTQDLMFYYCAGYDTHLSHVWCISNFS